MGWGGFGARTVGALATAALAAGILLATPVAATADKPDDPGRSSSVSVCKKGGWAALAPADDPAHPFRNQGECVQYLAQDGEPAATTGTPVQPGGKKGCKTALTKATHAPKDAATEPHGKPCKPRKAKVRGHKAD